MSGNPRWKGMAWGMVPCLGSAMCACTWHFFYNSPDLQVCVCPHECRSAAGGGAAATELAWAGRLVGDGRWRCSTATAAMGAFAATMVQQPLI